MSDPRFARLKSDPRFRRPRKKQSKVVIDDRFKHVLVAGKKVKSGGVDKYGRPVSKTNDGDNLRRFYRLENEEDPQVVQDYARGEVLLESSDEEQEDSQDNSESGEVITVGHHHSELGPVTGDDVEVEVDLHESSFAALDAQAAAYNESHPEIQQPQTKRTHRLAAVNLDWDHVRASHLYKICSSIVSPTALSVPDTTGVRERKKSSKGIFGNVVRGKVLSVRVYPSEFGRERMAREEKEGPPPEIFKKGHLSAEEEITPQSVYEIGDGNDYDEDALRKYQLERLRYYYAIITCDTVDAAARIYAELEGAELERSANVFDLSFVPDDMTFDHAWRDEATDDPNTAFKPVDFVTDALRHSKVKLTWDDDDPERNRITRRTLTRAEIEESDFKAFLASSSSDSGSEAGLPSDLKSSGKGKETTTKISRHKLRALLLKGDAELPEGWSGIADEQGDVDMEITFTPGLSEKKDHDESTLDKYQRKIREKRKRKKGEAKEKTLKGRSNGSQDEFFDDGKGDEHESDQISKQSAPPNNPQKSQSLSDTASRPPSTPEEFKSLISSNALEAEPKHFNIKSVLKAERNQVQKRKKVKKHRQEDDNELQDDFSIDVKDVRFKALHDDHQYAIDPSNPQFMKTKNMTALLEERSKRQQELRVVDSGDVPVREPTRNAERSLASLVESIKRKGTTLPSRGTGKRRKL